MKRAVFTIVAKNYLAHARALMESVAQTAPNVERFVVLVDEPEGCFDPDLEAFKVIYSKDLRIANVRWFHFKYTVVELSTAVKPYAARVLFEEYDVERLIYLDPDIILYDSPEIILRELDGADILLTPHLTARVDDDCRPDELDILRAGTYNLGFVALRRGPSALAMLRWWERRLYEHCVVSLEHGLFVDQRWMDLTPGLFSGVKVVRDQGWNVAYWNIGSRPVSLASGAPTAAGRPLVFFHFSGFDPLRPEAFSRHQNRFVTSDLGDAAKLVGDYKERLFKHGFSDCRSWTYTWSRFQDGAPVPDLARPVHHEDESILSTVEDPFSEPGKQAFAAVWNRSVLDPQGRTSGITRLAQHIYSLRTDVQTAMPDIFGVDAVRFRDWFTRVGGLEHRLPSFLVDPMHSPEGPNSEQAEPLAGDEAGEAVGPSGPVWLEVLLWNIPGLRARLSKRYSTLQFHDPETLADIERYLIEPQQQPNRSEPLPRVAELILASRRDVETHYGGSESLDEGGYLAWLLTYGRRELRLPPGVQEASRRSWAAHLDSLSWYGALRARLYCSALRLTSWRRSTLAEVAPPRLAQTIKNSEGHPATRQRPSLPSPTREARRFGVNLIGYIRAEMGVGESVRLAHSALQANKVPVAVRGISTNGVHSERDLRVSESGSLPYVFDLIHANADEFESAVARALGSRHESEFTIGYWAWELEEFPDRFDESFRFCAEIWTPSEFCRRAIEARSPAPVVAVPHPIRREIPLGHGREHFSIDPQRFVFLAMADMLSVPARKNPLGVIEAFLRAAPRMPGAELIVKLNNARHNVAALDEIREIADKGPVRILDTVLSRNEVDSLIDCSDCLVSLHRSEGFGLVMSEAMALGKPVVATAYSGNMDFMDEKTAFLVKYELGRVPEGSGPYRPGAFWAEPSLEHAAARMVEVFSDSGRRAAVGAAGQQKVRELLDPEAVGRRMLARLQVIERRLKQPRS